MAIRDFLILAISTLFVIQNYHIGVDGWGGPPNTTGTTRTAAGTTRTPAGTTRTPAGTTRTAARTTPARWTQPMATTKAKTTVKPQTTKLAWSWTKNYEYNENRYYPNKDYNNYNRYRESYGNNYNDYSSAEYRPIKRRAPDSSGYMNIYMRDSYKGGKSRGYKPIRFPVARYERRRFPLLGPFVNFMPWIPIFADRLTKQTIIYSPMGGVYIIPPVINFFGKLISVAELIASGYASLVSTGVPPPPALDVAPLVQPTPIAGPDVPTFDSSRTSFNGGVRTNIQGYPAPRYPASIRTNY